MDSFKFMGEDFNFDFSLNILHFNNKIFYIDDMLKNSGSWHNFGNNLWNETSSRWTEGHWNSFYGLGDFNNEIDKKINDTINSMNDVEKTFGHIRKTIEEIENKIDNITSNTNNLSKFGKVNGTIKFSYNVEKQITFKHNWDNRVNDLIKTFDRYNICAIIDTDNAEYDRYKDEVTGLIEYKIDFSKIKDIVCSSINKDRVIIECLFDSSINVRKKHNICFEKIFVDSNEIYDFSRDSYKDKECINERPTETPTRNPEIEKLVEKIEEQKQEIIVEEIQQPKWLKILDDTKKRFRKRTFEIVKKITEIDDIPVNCYIVKQIRGDKNRKRYTLNANDCELLGIEYHEGLEVLPGDLEYENVYKKVKNENYKEK